MTVNPVAAAKREIGKRIKVASKVHPEKSFPCVPLAEVPNLLRAMRAYVGTPVTRSLLWLVALTACRTGDEQVDDDRGHSHREEERFLVGHRRCAGMQEGPHALRSHCAAGRHRTHAA